MIPVWWTESFIFFFFFDNEFEGKNLSSHPHGRILYILLNANKDRSTSLLLILYYCSSISTYYALMILS